MGYLYTETHSCFFNLSA